MTLQDIVSIRVNHLRFINNLQQKELALRLGMSASTLNNKIHGSGRWGLEDSLALCEIFGVTIDYLTGQLPIESARRKKEEIPAIAGIGQVETADNKVVGRGDSDSSELGTFNQ